MGRDAFPFQQVFQFLVDQFQTVQPGSLSKPSGGRFFIARSKSVMYHQVFYFNDVELAILAFHLRVAFHALAVISKFRALALPAIR